MAMSLDPSMMQCQVNKDLAYKYGYKKKQSADNTPACSYTKRDDEE